MDHGDDDAGDNDACGKLLNSPFLSRVEEGQLVYVVSDRSNEKNAESDSDEVDEMLGSRRRSFRLPDSTGYARIYAPSFTPSCNESRRGKAPEDSPSSLPSTIRFDGNNSEEKIFFINATYRYRVHVGCACHLPRYASLCEIGGEKAMEMFLDEDRWVLVRLRSGEYQKKEYPEATCGNSSSGKKKKVKKKTSPVFEEEDDDDDDERSGQRDVGGSPAALPVFLFPLEDIEVAETTNRTSGGW
jgi:hypothetical protein